MRKSCSTVGSINVAGSSRSGWSSRRAMTLLTRKWWNMGWTKQNPAGWLRDAGTPAIRAARPVWARRDIVAQPSCWPVSRVRQAFTSASVKWSVSRRWHTTATVSRMIKVRIIRTLTAILLISRVRATRCSSRLTPSSNNSVSLKFCGGPSASSYASSRSWKIAGDFSRLPNSLSTQAMNGLALKNPRRSWAHRKLDATLSGGTSRMFHGHFLNRACVYLPGLVNTSTRWNCSARDQIISSTSPSSCPASCRPSKMNTALLLHMACCTRARRNPNSEYWCTR
mmetsp:Transcript_58491/g.128237  ORF Transcript_58491/g.128237 Transcript_58491/m.128237 type:complete len:282 (-) Transcript_58491:858-1703(-)